MNKPIYPPELCELPENIRTTALLFSTLAQTIFSYFNKETVQQSPLNFMILTTVTSHPEIPMSELAEKIGISKPQLSRSVNNLEKSNMIERIHNKDNRRVVNVYPIQEGYDLMDKEFHNVADKLNDTLSILSKADRTRLDSLMNESLEILSKAGIVNTPDQFNKKADTN